MLHDYATLPWLVIGASMLIIVIVAAFYFVAIASLRRRMATTRRDLEEQRGRFDALFDDSRDAIEIYDVLGNLLRANALAVSLFGRDASVTPLRYDGHVAPESHAAVKAGFEQAMRGQQASYEAEVFAANRTRIPVAVTAIPTVVAGELVGICAISHDLRATRAAQQIVLVQQELAEEEERFRSIFEQSPDPMALYDIEGRLTQANAAAANLMKFGRDIFGKPYEAHIAPEFRAGMTAHVDSVRRGQTSEFETMFVTGDGRRVPILATLSPIAVRGKVVGIAGHAKDLTETRIAQVRLMRAVAEFRSIFEYNRDAALMLDMERFPVRVNTAFEHLSGYGIEEILNTPFERLITPDDAQSVVENLNRAFAGESLEFDSILARADGRLVDVRARLVRVVVDSKTVGSFVFLSDVTEEHRLKEREQRQRERLSAVMFLAASHGVDVSEQVDRTLEVGISSLQFDAANVIALLNGEWRTLHSLGNGNDESQLGSELDIERSFARHALGGEGVLCIEDTQLSPWRDDVAHATQSWRSIIAAPIQVAGISAGILLFVGRTPRSESFDESDCDFVRVLASLVGAAMEHERRQEQLSELTRSHALITLSSRVALRDDVREKLLRAERSGGIVGVFYIDIDGLGAVSELYGEAGADEVLRIVEQRLRASMRQDDLLARIEGGEFVVLHDDVPAQTLRAFGESILKAMREAVEFANGLVQLGASVGVAVFPRDAREPGALVKLADAAMYVAKHTGKDRVDGSVMDTLRGLPRATNSMSNQAKA